MRTKSPSRQHVDPPSLPEPPRLSLQQRPRSRLSPLLFILLTTAAMPATGIAADPDFSAISERNRRALDKLLSTVSPTQQTVLIDDMLFRVNDLRTNSDFTGTPWFQNTIYFQYGSGMNQYRQQRWIEATKIWKRAAPLAFINGKGTGNYIRVQSGSTNSSYVGMVGGEQTLTIFNWESHGIIAHEIGHALGLVHEHQRSDRNTYVEYHPANLLNPSDSINFTLVSTGTIYCDYDFASIMHYSPRAFAQPGLETLTPRPPFGSRRTVMGQRCFPTRSDEVGMCLRYGGSPCPSCPPSGPGPVTETDPITPCPCAVPGTSASGLVALGLLIAGIGMAGLKRKRAGLRTRFD